MYRYGPATRTTERRSLAYDAHDRARRLAAKSALKYPPVQLTGVQARAVARGFADYLQGSSAIVRACAILPDHVHGVIANPGMLVEQMVIQLKSAATRQLEAEGIHPLTQFKQPEKRVPKCFTRGEWKVYLDPDDVTRAIQYVEDNPLKEGKKRQTWGFVRPL